MRLLRQLAFFSSVSILACRTTTPNVSEVRHDEGRFVPFTETALFTLREGPYYWADLSEQQYVQFAFHGVSSFLTPYSLPPDHPLVDQLNKWVQAAHRKVANSEKLRGFIPAPHVWVFPAKEPNAFVTATPVCVNAPVVVNIGKANEKTEEAESLLVDFDKVRPLGFNPFTERDEGCVDQPWSNDVDGFIAWFNAVRGPCQLKRSADGIEVVDSEGCASYSKVRAKRLAFPAATSTVAVSSAMLQVMNTEETAAAIVLHELGHYFGAHPVAASLPGSYGYFYKETAPMPPGKPPVVAENRALIDEVRPLHVTPATQLPGAKIEARALSVYLALINSFAVAKCDDKGPPCPAPCKEVNGFLSQDWFRELLFKSNLEGEFLASYLRSEPQLLACADATRIGEEPDSLQTKQVQAVIGSRFPGLKVDFGPTLGATLVAIGQASQDIDQRRHAFYTKLEKDRISYYTFEQEADDISLELSASLGLDPAAQAHSIWLFAEKASDGAFAEAGITKEQCLAGMDQKWKEQIADGHMPLPYLGWLTEPHHSLCYRSFNVYRELASHKYKRAATLAVQPLSKSQMANAAKDLQALTKKAQQPQPVHTPKLPNPNQRVTDPADILAKRISN